ncbi:hypothetical protein EVG20_g6653 [Dentipellis fragilis]|uniref:Peroxin-7 n=1 Tax=Dentipellis fragilis TaxID=205917 RepID=A0A4Y9YKW3_9AGAM|nr:hypothetical protein EVG20_g6653 [Dentipellis fragilis]
MALDAAIPNIYFTASYDTHGRLFDVRHPLPQIILKCSSYPMRAVTVAANHGIAPLIFTGGDDGLVRAWDVRHTRTCLYELSGGATHVEQLAWHEGQQSLYIASDWRHAGRESVDDDFDELSLEDEPWHWPLHARYDPDYFGRRYCAGAPSLLEYRFRITADNMNFD